MGENELKVTSIEELREIAKGELVELPPFIEGKKFIARLKRPSMLSMAKRGSIPNELLSEANTLFTSGANQLAANKIADSDMLEGMCDILDVVCKESMVQPTMKDLQEVGLDLTDEQKLFIFSYTQRGIEALKSFRE